MSNLPEKRKDLKDFEKFAGLSVDVLVGIEGCSGMHVGRYIHGCESWQVNGFNGDWKVVEWWPLPEKGTGVTQ